MSNPPADLAAAAQAQTEQGEVEAMKSCDVQVGEVVRIWTADGTRILGWWRIRQIDQDVVYPERVVPSYDGWVVLR